MKNSPIEVHAVFVSGHRGLALHNSAMALDAELIHTVLASPGCKSRDSSRTESSHIRRIPWLTPGARTALSRSDLSERSRIESKRGFTLLEVLLTSLLASVVLVSLWALSDIYLKLFAVGKLKIEETQLVRGLTEKIASDVTQVIQISQNDPESKPGRMLIQIGRVDPLPIGGTSSTTIVGPRPRLGGAESAAPPIGGAPTGGPPPGGEPPVFPRIGASENASISTADQSSDRNAPKFGLFGTSDALRLIILRTDPRTVREATDLMEIIPQPGQMRPALATELRTIEYTFSRSVGDTSATRQRPAGLLRREWAWETWVGLKYASIKPTDESTYSDMLPDSNAEWTEEDALAFETGRNILHIPQVVDIEFYYYDGSSWDIEWNSWERGGLPQLVEVTLQVKIGKDESNSKIDTEEADEDTSSFADGATAVTSGKVYRRLIYLPFADSTQSSGDRDRHAGADEVANTNLPARP